MSVDTSRAKGPKPPARPRKPMSWHQVFGPGGPVLDSLDLRDRGVLGAVAHDAPVAPPRPAPEVVAHYTLRLGRVSRELERARLQLWAYQRGPRRWP